MSRQSALRRYPAMGFLAVAALLATLLPTALTVPLSGPSSLAELAPVPPSGESTDQVGDLSEVGEAGSAGLGVGAGQGGGAGGGAGGQGGSVGDPGPDPAPSLGQRRPRSKRCVGKPPRQTEDLLSPPCVAFFHGANGGATTRGVTRDEIKVVIHLGSDANERRLVDYDDPDAHHSYAPDVALEPVLRAYARYFNDRYQTFGRRVHFWGYSGDGVTPEEIRTQVGEIVERVDPFAVLPIGLSSVSSVAREAAERGLLSLSYTSLDRRLQARLAPLLLSYSPDIQNQAATAASFVCRKLVGRPARFSGNAGDVSTTRRFGLLFEENANVPEFVLLKDLTKHELATQCGLRDVPEAGARASQASERATSVAAMRSEQVTTMIVFGSSGSPLLWGNTAEAQGYHPEWIFPGEALDHSVDDSTLARMYPPVVWAHAFGLRFDYRRPAPRQQHWYHAFREACAACDEPTDFRSGKVYDALMLLFWGIQSAGPRLTPANIDKGLHAIPPRASVDPTMPAAYFAPGNYSWVKDAMAVWWDASGAEPGGKPGCYRMARQGNRHRPGEWPTGDGDLYRPEQTCQGPARPR